jgi:integrase
MAKTLGLAAVRPMDNFFALGGDSIIAVQFAARARDAGIHLVDWKGVVDTPKGGRGRVVPLTDALYEALRKVRHLRGDRVLTLDDGSPVARSQAARLGRARTAARRPHRCRRQPRSASF